MSTFSRRTISWARRNISFRISECRLSISRALAMCSFGMIRTWSGACGLISWNAKTWDDSKTILAGISWAAMRQKRHALTILRLYQFLFKNQDRTTLEKLHENFGQYCFLDEIVRHRSGGRAPAVWRASPTYLSKKYKGRYEAEWDVPEGTKKGLRKQCKVFKTKSGGYRRSQFGD